MSADPQGGDLPSRILHHVYQQSTYVTLPSTLSALLPDTPARSVSPRDHHNAYMRVYRALKALKSQDKITLHKGGDGLIWISITPTGLLTCWRGCETKTHVNAPPSNSILPRRACAERRKATYIPYTHKQLTDLDTDDINWLFSEYLTRINGNRILLKRKPDAPSSAMDWLLLPHTCRFNHPQIPARNLKNFDQVIDESLRHYSSAVHLILTTDPKRHKSLLHSWQHFGKAWNRFKARIRKRFGRTIPYICSYEFTKSGLMHAHILLFGVSRLGNMHQISTWWETAGQGSYVWAYTLRNDNGRWLYARSRPRGADRGRTASDYLKKYLKKAVFAAETQALYWVSNKRYFSAAKTFWRLFEHPKPPLGLYKFVLSLPEHLIPQRIYDEILHCEAYRAYDPQTTTYMSTCPGQPPPRPYPLAY